MHNPPHTRSPLRLLHLSLYWEISKHQYRYGRNSKGNESNQTSPTAEAAGRIESRHSPQVTNQQGDGERLHGMLRDSYCGKTCSSSNSSSYILKGEGPTSSVSSPPTTCSLSTTLVCSGSKVRYSMILSRLSMTGITGRLLYWQASYQSRTGTMSLKVSSLRRPVSIESCINQKDLS